MGDVEDPDFDIEEVLLVLDFFYFFRISNSEQHLQVLKKGKERTEELTQKLKSMAGLVLYSCRTSLKNRALRSMLIVVRNPQLIHGCEFLHGWTSNGERGAVQNGRGRECKHRFLSWHWTGWLSSLVAFPFYVSHLTYAPPAWSEEQRLQHWPNIQRAGAIRQQIPCSFRSNWSSCFQLANQMGAKKEAKQAAGPRMPKHLATPQVQIQSHSPDNRWRWLACGSSSRSSNSLTLYESTSCMPRSAIGGISTRFAPSTRRWPDDFER